MQQQQLLSKQRLTLLILVALSAAVLGQGPRGVEAAGNSITSPDQFNIVGRSSSLKLDASGKPVIAYADTENETIKVLHCGDPNCAAGNSKVTVDAGSDPSLALDSVGNPVVSYVWAGLKILHCNDANCAAGGDSITTPDASNGVGENSSLALDGSGFPVVAYHDNSANLDLKLMHCNDANCGGGDESITVPDGPGTVGSSPSLVLDASGNPVVTYAGNPGLRLLHCDDPDCSGGGDSITTPDSGAGFFSLALDAAGNPVVAYRDLTNLDLKVLHCDDPNCSGGGDTIASPDEFGDTGFAPSLTLDNVGRPVVSYQFNTGPDRHLRILHCGNPTCSGPNMLVSGDLATWVGDDSSIVLDAAGNPVVSYYDAFFSDLKLLHCADRACVGGVGGETQLTDIAGATTDSSDWSLFVATSVMLMIMLGAGVYGLQRRQSRR